jgi:hypothetical protein
LSECKTNECLKYLPEILGWSACGTGVFEEGSQAGVVVEDGPGIGVAGVLIPGG